MVSLIPMHEISTFMVLLPVRSDRGVPLTLDNARYVNFLLIIKRFYAEGISMKKFLAVMVFGLASGFAFAAEVDVSTFSDETLSGEKAKEVLAGKSITGVNSMGQGSRFNFVEDGKLFGAAAGYSDSGTWHIKGDEVCLVWRNWTNTCRRAVVAGGLLSLRDGSGAFQQKK